MRWRDESTVDLEKHNWETVVTCSFFPPTTSAQERNASVSNWIMQPFAFICCMNLRYRRHSPLQYWRENWALQSVYYVPLRAKCNFQCPFSLVINDWGKKLGDLLYVTIIINHYRGLSQNQKFLYVIFPFMVTAAVCGRGLEALW